MFAYVLMLPSFLSPSSLHAHVFSTEADAWLCQLTDMKQHISDKTGTLFDVVAVKCAWFEWKFFWNLF